MARSPSWAEAGQPEEGPQRRCIASGRSLDKSDLIRFVIGPDSRIVADLDGKLPGRGVYVAPERAMIERAVAKGLFAKSLRERVRAEPGLAQEVEAGLLRRVIEAIGLARRAGQAVSGFERVRERLAGGGVGLVLEAADGAAGGRGKLRLLAPGVPVMDGLTAEELGQAFGRESAVHAVVDRGRLADRIGLLGRLLAGFRPEAAAAAGPVETTANEAG